jgi:dipeptidyl aminopeptidase/acylaminoacyl peptidase
MWMMLMPTTATVSSAQAIRPHWSKTNDRCWYQTTDPTGRQSFFVVDIQQKSRKPAFDRQRLAVAMSGALQEDISANDLSVDFIQFGKSNTELLLLADNKSWALDLETYNLRAVDALEVSQAGRLYLPPRRSQASGESAQVLIENRLPHELRIFWVTPDGDERSYGEIGAGKTHRTSTYVGHTWLLKSDGENLGCFSAQGGDRFVIDAKAIENVVRREAADLGPSNGRSIRHHLTAPDESWVPFVRDHNLWLRNGSEEKKLSHDGTEEKSFARRGSDQPQVYWSADSKFLVAFQTTSGTERTVSMVESSPKNQLQPRLQTHKYPKPGDDISVTQVRLFSLADMEEIPVSDELLKNPWSIQFDGWSASNETFYVHYNARGHQTIRVVGISAKTGAAKPIIEETSSTFIQYSDPGKSVFESLPGEQILWASERSGWNHLYRYARESGKLLNAVTSGEWNVKRIENVDRDAGVIWFYAVGIHPGQDPYHEHFCRVNFDGSELRILTEGDGTHKVTLQQDDQFLIDTYSRVDMAPVTELRSAEEGELICELAKDDTADQFGDRRVTERFVAKGRDGKTDIWGIIHWPRELDLTKKYPIVESIYAGPHDHHVPKSFRSRYQTQHRIADEGMIVVQIDGMGTAWRSKEFHDVCYKNLKDAGFPDRIAWIQAAAKKFPHMDTSRVGIYGGSAGGQNAMAALLWHNEFYKVAIADCGCHDNRMDKIWWNEQWMGWPIDESYRENSNTENAHLLKGNLMLIVGELDRNVDPASTTQVVHQLIQHDKDFEFVLVTGTGHGSAETPWASRKRLNFLKQHLSVP